MTIESPVWKDDAELIRYTAMPPKSSAAPQRRSGRVAMRSASHAPTQGDVRRPEPGRFDQEWGPAWEADPNFAMALPFYGFGQARLVINHGDTAGGHYRRWLRQEHPEVAALCGPEHALPTPDYLLSKFQQAWRTRVPEERSTSSYVGAQTCAMLTDLATRKEPFSSSVPSPIRTIRSRHRDGSGTCTSRTT